MAAKTEPRRARTLAELRADPRIKEVWNEGKDGWWASLKPGFNAEGCSAVHSETVKKLLYDVWWMVTEGEPY